MTLRDKVMRVVRVMRAGYCAPALANGIHGFYEGMLALYATKLERAVAESEPEREVFAHSSKSAQSLSEAVGTAGPMPGTDGFTLAAFEASKVPVGTKLYTIPPGYTLVPIEPTEEMIDAARNDHEGAPYLPVSLWRSMLAAAPKYNDGNSNDA